MADAITLYCWGSKARGFLPSLVAEAGGLNYTWNKLDGDLKFAELKSHTPFGQAPFLVHGGIRIGQSGAITRYLARIGGLQGSTDADYAMSEMLLSEYEDIYNMFVKAKYSDPKDQVAAWSECLETKLPKQLTYLEALLKDGNPYFTTRGPCVGDLAIFCGLNVALDCNPRILQLFPKLQRFYGAVCQIQKLQAYFAQPMPLYFERVTAEAPPQPVTAATQSMSSMPTSDYGPGIHGRRILQAPGGTSTISFFG